MKAQFTLITEDLTLEEMKSITDNNTRSIKLLNEEVTRLKNCSLSQHEVSSDDMDPVVLEEDYEDMQEETLLEEIEYYFAKIGNITFDKPSDILLSKIKKELPSKKNPNYQTIIYGINALLLKECNEIMMFIETEKNDLSKDELEEFRKEVFDIQTKINLIVDVDKEDVDISVITNEEEKLNNIVFLETASGNIYALEDLDNNRVPKEYYGGFYDLFKSIQDGTFKNVKFLTSNNNKTAGISEVKGFKKRVIFDRVGYDTYVIIGVFTKKSDMDKGYIEPIKNRIAIYRKRRDSIVEKVKDKDYIEEQEQILDKLYEILNHQDEKTLQKELV